MASGNDDFSARNGPAPAGAPQGPPALDSASLFVGGREVLLFHRGEVYRLRLTRSDKLILTK